jgi:hypothetical protein
MSKYRIDHINPSEENAQIITELRHIDLRNAGMSRYDANEFADPLNDSHVECQFERLRDYPERYIGATAIRCSELVGFCEIYEWKAADQLRYSRGIERLAMLAIANFGDDQLRGKPIGIHEMAVDGDIDDRYDIVSRLLDEAISIAGSHEVRIAKYKNDTFEPPLLRRGFESTGKYGIVNGVNQQLYSRPPYIPVAHRDIRTPINIFQKSVIIA